METLARQALLLVTARGPRWNAEVRPGPADEQEQGRESEESSSRTIEHASSPFRIFAKFLAEITKRKL